ncbi:MAG: type VI secretion system tube protein Hcp [Pseudomonadota bacterium]
MASDFFLKLEGIEGESADDAHPNEIVALSWSWGVSQSGSAHMGAGAGAGKASAQDMSFTKFVDKSSPELMKRCSNGKHVPTATLIARKAGEKPLEYLKITMTDVLISSYQTGGSGGEDLLVESVTLNFGAIEVEYTEQGKDGSKGKATKAKFDIAKNVTT